MKKLLLLLLFSSNLFAQNEPVLSFVNKESNVGYGGNVFSSKSTKDSAGNTYLVGTFSNLADFDPSSAEANLTALNNIDGDMYIAKYNANGGFVWAKSISGSGYTTCTGIVIGGNFMYLIGQYTNTVDFDPSANTTNLTANGVNPAAFLAKYDLNGFLVMAKSIDGGPVQELKSISFYNNQLVISGYFSGVVDFDPSVNILNLQSNGFIDIFLAKYSTSFVPQWAFNIGGVVGSTDINTSTSSVIDGQGNIIISGDYVNTVDFNYFGISNTLTNSSTTSIRNTYIAKYTTSGSLLWAKDIGGRHFSILPENSKLGIDASNNIITAGNFDFESDFDPSATIANLTPAGTSTYIAKYDTNGNYTWAKKVSLCNNLDLTLTNTSNNIVICGTFSSNTADFDPGTPVYNLNTANGTNYFASYDGNGNFIYANNLKVRISTMHANENNGVYLSGSFNGAQDFDPSSNTANLSSLFYNNAFLSKYDNTGAYVYGIGIGGNKPNNSVNNLIATDGVGNIYRAGGLSATTDLDPTAGTFNVSSLSGPGIFISKHTSTGNLIWAKTISGDKTSSLTVMNTDTNGNTYIIGRYTGTVDFDPSANVANFTNTSTIASLYMAKYDTNGNYLWAKQIDGTLGASKKILFDTAGNFYINGRLNGTEPIDFDPSPSSAVYITPTGFVDMFFAKFSPLGDYIWAKSIAGVDSGSGMNEYHFVIHGNNLYLTGIFYGGYIFNTVTNDVIGTDVTTTYAGYIAKYDLDGNYQFAGILTNSDLTSYYQSNGEALAVDDNDDIYLISQFSGTVDFDIDPTTEYNLSSLIDVDANNLSSYAISKYSASGSLLWAKAINCLDLPGFTFRKTQAFITNNQLMFCNTFAGNVDFDPSTNDYILSAPTDTYGEYIYNLFVAKYDTATGDFIWANKLDSNGDANLDSACLDSNQNLLISGSFTESVDFDFSSAIQNVTSTSANNLDRFWAKYSTATLGLGENILTKGYSIYPNPTNGELFVSHPLNSEFNITITDITGKILKTTTLQNNESLDVSYYPQGMYFIQIVSRTEKNTYKFIKK